MSVSRECTVAVVVGTRPDAIKLSPVIRELGSAPDLRTIVVATAQHRDLLDQMLDFFGVRPHFDLDVMRPQQDIGTTAARILERLGPVLDAIGPDLVVVQGDTTTALAAALASVFRRIPVAHVEAGLRSGNRDNPFPEEINREIVSRLASLHLAPTRRNGIDLVMEGISPATVVVTGNPVVDALLYALERNMSDPPAALVALRARAAGGRRPILVTLHRRESFGEPLLGMLKAIREIHDRNPDVLIVFPVHRNPAVRDVVHLALGGLDRVWLTEPLDYRDFVGIMAESWLILSDSGGVQEEAPTLGVPLLILRDVTERPEVVEAGAARLVGRDPEAILHLATLLLSDAELHASMCGHENPFGDGRASARIVAAIREFLAAEPGPVSGRRVLLPDSSSYIADPAKRATG